MIARSPLKVLDPSLLQFINADFDIQKLKDDCAFSEGPVWNPEGFYLFSDIPKNVIYNIAPGSSATIYLENSGCTPGNTRQLAEQIGSNGLAYDKDGALLICQHGDGAVVKFTGKSAEPFIKTYKGRPFNSPNDIVAHPNGSIIFSDPPYGLKDQQLQPGQNQPVAGFYCWRNGELKLITDRYQYPNGVCLSADGNSFYTCSTKPFEAFVLEWDVETLQMKRAVCAENSDGIKSDRYGNLYLCSKDGIVIVNNDGKRLGVIELETTPANCCWGGAAGNDLLITARHNIFHIRNLQKA